MNPQDYKRGDAVKVWWRGKITDGTFEQYFPGMNVYAVRINGVSILFGSGDFVNG